MELLDVIGKYRWLTDSYVIDYIVDDHWNKLPQSWRDFFTSLDDGNDGSLVQLVHYILHGQSGGLSFMSTPPPLSLTSLKYVASRMSLPFDKCAKNPSHLANVLGVNTAEDAEFPNLAELTSSVQRTKIKAKKVHEIGRIVALVQVLMKRVEAEGSPMEEIVDVGAGLGHLSRILTLLTDLRVRTVEGNEALVDRSKLIDRKVVKGAMPTREAAFIREEAHLTSNSDLAKLLMGVHTCGDLCPTILRHFLSDVNSKALIHFGCCHHKLNGGLDKPFRDEYDDVPNIQVRQGFPLSQKYASARLSYAARGLACFSHEQFLREMDGHQFYVNSYRAILEWLFVNNGKTAWRHRRCRGVKTATSIGFWDYVKIALKEDADALHFNKTDPDIDNFIKQCRRQMPIFYTLRLMLAPLVETLIYLDRKQFLEENDVTAYLVPLFDAAISPRNVALVGIKNKTDTN